MRGTIPDKRWLYFVMVAGGVLLSTMDSSMVNVALPEIMRTFRIDLPKVKLVVLVYLMIITFSLVFCGRAGDRYGKGKIYLSGMIIFTVGAVACAASTNFTGLVVFRAIQALGASMMMSTGPAILKLTTPHDQLGKTLGLVGIATSCGLMSGPLISGLVLHYFSWRAVFLVSLPLALSAICIAAKYLLKDLAEIENGGQGTFDWSGSVLWVVVVASYVLLVNGSFTGWFVNGLVVCAITAFLWMFLKAEAKADSPIMPMKLVCKRYYWTSVVAAAISFAALFIILILLPFYLDYVLEYPVRKIGLTMMALPVSLVIISPLSGWLFDRMKSARYISTAGLFISSLAIYFLMQLGNTATFIDVFWRLVLLGAGQSIFLAPNSASVLTSVPDAFAGITSGILATARNFGMLTGAALAGTTFGVLFSRFTGGATLQLFEPQYIDAFLHAQKYSFAVALILLITGCCISWFRG